MHVLISPFLWPSLFRYCGVSNSFVKRTIDGKSVGAIPHPMNLMGAAMQSKPNTVSKTSLVQPLKQEHAGKSAKIDVKPSTLETSNDKSNNPAPENFDRTSKPDLGKEATCAVQATRKKGQCEKTSSASSGSLANLWGRASTKLKPSAPSIETDKVVSKVARKCTKLFLCLVQTKLLAYIDADLDMALFLNVI